MQQHAAIGAERGEEGDISIWYDNVTHVYICTDDSSSALCMRVKTASISVSLKKPMKTKQNSPVMRDASGLVNQILPCSLKSPFATT